MNVEMENASSQFDHCQRGRSTVKISTLFPPLEKSISYTEKIRHKQTYE
jgi:hypothetical protein